MARIGNDFEGRAALVTGASNGIGWAIAQRLGEYGAFVAGTSTTAEGAVGISKMFYDNKIKGVGVELDITDQETIKGRLDNIVEAAGRPVSLLVNNAGITRDGIAFGMKEGWDEVIATNLTGTFRVTQAVMRGMIKAQKRDEMPKADVVTIGSVVGQVGEAGQVNYAAAKAGLAGMTKSLAKEYPGIRFNQVDPGFVATRMTSGLPEERVQKILSMTKSGVPLTPEQIAEAVHEVLLGDKTGEIVTIDDGLVEYLNTHQK